MAKLGTQYGDLMVSKKVDDVVMYLFENMEHDWMELCRMTLQTIFMML